MANDDRVRLVEPETGHTLRSFMLESNESVS
jgi:hypothetical protein